MQFLTHESGIFHYLEVPLTVTPVYFSRIAFNDVDFVFPLTMWNSVLKVVFRSVRVPY